MKADIACTDLDCTGIMTYVSGVTFTCDTCEREFAPSWQIVDHISTAVYALAIADRASVDDVIRIALNEQRIVGDPDNYPDLSDIPAMLGNPHLDTRWIVAWAAWERDREMVADQVA